jgi:hypothetical protein
LPRFDVFKSLYRHNDPGFLVAWLPRSSFQRYRRATHQPRTK